MLTLLTHILIWQAASHTILLSDAAEIPEQE